jgi:hypothetical protein
MRTLQSSWSLIDRIPNKPEASPLKKSVQGELRSKDDLHQRSIPETLLLWELLRIRSGKTKLKRAIVREYKKHGKKLPVITRDSLKTAYEHLSKKLTKAYEKSESRTTKREDDFAQILSAFFPKRLIHQGIWIGNHTIDVFLLFRHRDYLGYGFELDGDQHEAEEVISKKDTHKENYLCTDHALATKRVLNQDIRTKTIFSDLIGISKSGKELDSKSNRNFWNRVYIETIAQCHRKNKFREIEPRFFRGLTNTSQPLLDALLRIISKQKRSYLLKRTGIFKEKFITRADLHPKQSRLQFRCRNSQTTKNKGEIK